MPGTMPNRRFDLVIADIDGCLSPESSHPFDLDSLAKVRSYNESAWSRGDRPLITLCSGRPQPFVEAMCRLIGTAEVPAVCENGAWLFTPSSNRYELDPDITLAHRAAVHAAEDWCLSTFGPRGVTIQPGKAASVTLYHPDTDFLRSLVPTLEAEYARRGWPFRVSMTWLYINCDLRHISKASGLDRLLARARYDRARLAGIGDTLGDKAIADRVGFFACPANAHPAIKEHAHFVASAPEAQGVLQILEQLVH